MTDLAKRLRIKAGMIEMGERIAWGSDSALMREAADALEQAAPAVQGEPVAWQRVDRPERIITVLSRRTWKEVEDGVEFRALYAAPQPAEQQPDVAQLVEALEEIVKQYPNPNISHENFRVHACRHAESALAAYRKGGEQ